MLESGEDDEAEDEEFSSVFHRLSPLKQAKILTTVRKHTLPPPVYQGKQTANVQITNDQVQDKYHHRRCIIHIDIDCFYAQVEMIRDPSLCNVPLGIQQKYLVVTCNYVARARGVKKLMSVVDARKVCPDLKLVKGEDLLHYREYSEKVHNFMSQYCSRVEKLGFDENFLDVTEIINQIMDERNESSSEYHCLEETLAGHCYNEPGKDLPLKVLEENLRRMGIEPCKCGCHLRLLHGSMLSQRIREELYQAIGFTSCAGIAHNKILAKLAGEMHKPNQQTTILAEMGKDFMRGCKIKKIPGIGYSYGKVLTSLGINNVHDFDAVPRVVLQKHFGPRITNFMIETSHGIDNSSVEKSGAAKSVSEEESFKELKNLEDVYDQLRILIRKLLKRLESRPDKPGTIRLTVRKRQIDDNPSRMRESKQEAFRHEILSIRDVERQKQIILDIAISLLRKLINVNDAFDLSLINLCFTNFKETSSSRKLEPLASYLSTSCRARSDGVSTLTKASYTVQNHANLSSSVMAIEDGIHQNKQEDMSVDPVTAITNAATGCEDTTLSTEKGGVNTVVIQRAVMSSSSTLPFAASLDDKRIVDEGSCTLQATKSKDRPSCVINFARNQEGVDSSFTTQYTDPRTNLENSDQPNRVSDNSTCSRRGKESINPPSVLPTFGLIPKDVDKEVLEALPSDLREELLTDWAAGRPRDPISNRSGDASRRLGTSVTTMTPKRKANSILLSNSKASKRSKCTKNKTQTDISDYFASR